MNELTKFLVESVIGTEFDKPKTSVALFGGGFKPPTKGHLEVILQGLKLAPEVNKLKIIVGGGVRDGITQKQSKEIWEIYDDANLIPISDVEIIEASPFKYLKDYLKNHPDDKTYVFIGSRDGNDDDKSDVEQRSKYVKNYSDNVFPLEVSTGGSISGTEARKLLKTDLDGFRNMLPANLTQGEVDKIVDILNNKSTDSTPKPTSNKTDPLTPKEENIDPTSQKKHKGKSSPFGSAYEPLNESENKEYFDFQIRIKNDSYDDLGTTFNNLDGRIQKSTTSVDGNPLIFNYRNVPSLVKAAFKAKNDNSEILIYNDERKGKVYPLTIENIKLIKKPSSLNENATYSSKIDYKQQIKDLTKHMIKKGMNILPLPRVIFKHGDQENASQFLGKTAYYSPSDMTIVLYTEGRHPKDIARSFAHEMIHHIQNIEDRLENINTTNTTEDDNLNDIEREAYTKGNMTFRNWTDSLDGEEVTSLNENILPQEKFAQEKNQDYIEQALKILPNKGKYNLKNYSVEILPIDKIKPTQFGEDYINASSEYEAEQYQKYIDGEIEAEDLRREDFYPIVVDKDTMEILDGNHRHAVHTMLSIPKIKAILVSKKLNEAIVGEKIECDNCGWSWNIVDGGDDLYICHKCDHDNEPENGDPFGLKAYARELMEDFNIEDIKPATKSLEEQERVRIFNPNCGCDKT